MFSRRQFVGSIPIGAIAMTAVASSPSAHSGEADSGDTDRPLIASPPVIQNPRTRSFGVSIAVGRLATAWVEYGFAEDDLSLTAVASHHGLIRADDRALHVRVAHSADLPTDRPIYYRVVAQSLSYRGAYQLQRGPVESTDTFALHLPDPSASSFRAVSINDTHENLATIESLHQQVERLDPGLLIWNGDTCNDFDATDEPEQILLNPAKNPQLGWAANRPLLFSNGNHDVRGVRAREVVRSFAGSPESGDLPYNQAQRFGPVAIVTLDTGEDKPDRHPVFAGTAAYEPYRQRQAEWLANVVQSDSIVSAPFKIAACHIPLRGAEGHNDGTSLEGYARYSGFGAKLWLPILKDAGFQAVLSGHTHRHRIDPPTPEMPICQLVGGGPKPSQATLTVIEGKQDSKSAELEIRIVDLNGKTLHSRQWST